ncbi:MULTISPECIES: DUF4365 domain-containing protein [unclassified Phenylobacterium]|uniref:DUF4365 domain-containing protein n=1 Tax=unclassified Phenylobacterium TaxID=2640670 RepID=UPI00083B6F5C|nr:MULTISPECIES: DUF4365 domain-containing protein [unclassified Phenylobacterium]
MARDTDKTNRLGVHAVGLLFEKLGWIFREQTTSDYGVDAIAEQRAYDGTGAGKLIALQIKTGASYFRRRGADYVYYGEARHLDYWTNHSLPVLLVLHDPDTGLTLWQWVARHLTEEAEDGRWSMTIPARQTLDAQSAYLIASGVASDLGSLRRARLALDLEHIRLLAGQDTVYMRVDEYVNKTLNMRGAEFTFSDEPDGECDLHLMVSLPAPSIDYYMAVEFPWLYWETEEYVDESEGAYEIAQHILKVEVNEIGKAMLRLEEFYASEPPDPSLGFDDGYDLLADQGDEDPDPRG